MHDIFRPQFPELTDSARKKRESLRRFVESLLLSRGLTTKTERHRIEGLAAENGIGDHDFCGFDLEIDGDAVFLAVIPRNRSSDSEMSERFRGFSRQAEALGIRLLTVPETLLRQSAGCGSRGDGIQVTGADRFTVMSFFLRHGSAGLFELAALLEHRNPVGAILELEVAGALTIHGGGNMTRDCRVSLPGFGG
jgi:hypothetical protein